MTSKIVRVDRDLFERVKTFYINQSPPGAVYKDSQIANMALNHVLGREIDVKIKKNKTIIKCY